VLSRAFSRGNSTPFSPLLFGVGFSIQLERLREKTTDWRKIFFRRLSILFLFGFIHLQFLWTGDILVLYAFLGFFLTLFIEVNNRTLIISAASLLLLPILIDAAVIPNELKPWDWLENQGLAIDAKNGIPNDDVAWRTYPFDPTHGFQEFWHWIQPAPFYRLHGFLVENRIPRVLGMFLLGYFLGRKKYFHQVDKHHAAIKKAMFYGLVIGIPANVVYFASPEGLLKAVAYHIGVPTLAIAYMAIISLLPKREKFFQPFASVGRMALTNYLSQTIICLLLFYSIGLGLGGNIGATTIFLIGLLIYVTQITLSNFWLKRHPYGPMEALWRKLTYLKTK